MADELITILLVGGAVLLPLILLLWGSARVLRDLQAGQRRDVLLGIVGIIALNMGVYLGFSIWHRRLIPLSELPVWLPWALNLVPILILAFVRRWVAIGIVLFFGFLLTWAFLAGALFFISCLVVGAFLVAFGVS